MCLIRSLAMGVVLSSRHSGIGRAQMLPDGGVAQAGAALWSQSMPAMKDLPRGRTLDLFANDMAADDPRPAATAERREIDAETDVASAWRATATAIRDWMDERGVDRREAVVLVPFVQLIDPLRRTLAAGGGWMPRVETARTLAESLAPAPDAAGGAPTLSPPIDRLIARKLLLGQRWGVEWSRRDGLGFDQAIGRLVATVHELLQAMATKPPAGRAAAWEELERALPPSGRRERDLAAIAVRWAALAPPPRTDALFGLSPSAWIAIEAGGPDALVGSLLAEGTAPTLTLVLDPPEGALFAWPASRPVPVLGACPGFEDEAQSAAAQVLTELSAGRRPVALVAHDRLLVRRVHELLVRSGAQVVDETGWRLSTTRAAAGFMALLHSARHDAGNDALLDWLKSGTRWGRHDRHAIAALEARVRRAGVSRVAGLATVPLHDAAAERLRDDAVAVLRPLQGLGVGAAGRVARGGPRGAPRQRRPLAPGRRRGRHGSAAGAAARPRSRRARRAPGGVDRSFAEPGRVHALVRRGSRAGHLPSGTEPFAGCDRRRRRCPRHAARASDAAPLRRRRAPRLRRAPRRLAGARGPAAARGRQGGRHRLAGGAAAARAARLRPAAARRAADLAAPGPRRRRVAGAQPARRAASPLAVDPGAGRFARGPIRGSRSRCRRHRCAAPRRSRPVSFPTAYRRRRSRPSAAAPTASSPTRCCA